MIQMYLVTFRGIQIRWKLFCVATADFLSNQIYLTCYIPLTHCSKVIQRSMITQIRQCMTAGKYMTEWQKLVVSVARPKVACQEYRLSLRLGDSLQSVARKNVSNFLISYLYLILVHLSAIGSCPHFLYFSGLSSSGKLWPSCFPENPLPRAIGHVEATSLSVDLN